MFRSSSTAILFMLVFPVAQTIKLRSNGGTTRQKLVLPAGQDVAVTLSRTPPPAG